MKEKYTKNELCENLQRNKLNIDEYIAQNPEKASRYGLNLIREVGASEESIEKYLDPVYDHMFGKDINDKMKELFGK